MDGKKSAPTLSLCMIVKNEEKFLGQCLESVKDVVDEMIIVDTGSEDKTIQIAESYGACVYHHPWQGSFSEARNYALQFATCDWILQMDADEQLESEDIPILKEVIKRTVYNAVYVALLNDSPEGWTKHYFQRIYKRGKARYEGIVHNQLIYEGADVTTEIRIYHWGYNLSNAGMQAKFERSGELLRKQIEEDGTNPFAHQNYVRILRASLKFDEAVKEGLYALRICKDRMTEIHYQMIAYDTAYSMLNSNRVDDSIQLCLEVLAKHPNNMDMLYTYASALLTKKQYEDAIFIYKELLALQAEEAKNPKHTRLIVDTINFDHRVWGNLSECYYHVGNLAESEIAIQNAIQIKPNMYVYKIAYAWLMAKTSRIQEARKVIDACEQLEGLDSVYYEKLSALFKNFPSLGDPLDVYEKAVNRFPDSDEIHNMYGYAVLGTDPTLAEKELVRAIQLNPDHVGARFGLIKLYMHSRKKEKLEPQILYFRDKLDKHPLQKEVGKYCLNEKYYQWAIDLLSNYLACEPENTEILSDISTAYAKLGQYDAALFGYRQALLRTPNDTKIIQNIELVHKLNKIKKNEEMV